MMFRDGKPLTLQQAQTYYTREYARGDYNTGSGVSPEESTGIWSGRGAFWPAATYNLRPLPRGRAALRRAANRVGQKKARLLSGILASTTRHCSTSRACSTP